MYMYRNVVRSIEVIWCHDLEPRKERERVSGEDKRCWVNIKTRAPYERKHDSHDTKMIFCTLSVSERERERERGKEREREREYTTTCLLQPLHCSSLIQCMLGYLHWGKKINKVPIDWLKVICGSLSHRKQIMNNGLEINSIIVMFCDIRVIYLICVCEILWYITLLFDYATSIISCQKG